MSTRPSIVVRVHRGGRRHGRAAGGVSTSEVGAVLRRNYGDSAFNSPTVNVGVRQPPPQRTASARVCAMMQGQVQA
jgi:hypothetical protein